MSGIIVNERADSGRVGSEALSQPRQQSAIKVTTRNVILGAFRVKKRWAACNGPLLTFDDGPHPEVTPAVLELLAKYNGRAVFF